MQGNKIQIPFWVMRRKYRDAHLDDRWIKIHNKHQFYADMAEELGIALEQMVLRCDSLGVPRPGGEITRIK